jgi:hypothetical protein
MDGAYMGGDAGLRGRQTLSTDRSAEWSPKDRLYRAVTLDAADGRRIAGDDRAAIDSALERANLRAPAPATARYAVQVSRHKGPDRGTMISYRLLERASNRTLFQQDMPAGRGDASITRFIVALGAAEHATFATVLPCVDSAEVRAAKGAIVARGGTWRTDNCLAYQQDKADGGLRFSSNR